MKIYSNRLLSYSDILKIYLKSRLYLCTSKECNIYTIKNLKCNNNISIRSHSSLDMLSHNYIYYSYTLLNDTPTIAPSKFYINFVNTNLNVFLPKDIKNGDIISIFRNTNYVKSGHILLA